MKSYIVHIIKYLKLKIEMAFPLFKCRATVDIIEVCSPYKSIFCGYYDLSPFRPNDSNLLLLHCSNIKPYDSDPYSQTQKIALYNIKSRELRELNSTSAWNWQQGARLTWLNADQIVFNDFYGDELVGRVIDSEGNNLIHGRPFYCNFGIGRYLSCDFVGLSMYSEYGYEKLRTAQGTNNLILVDYIKGSDEVLINLDLLAEPTPENAYNIYFNHFLPSPAQKRIIFVRRYYVGKTRYDDLFHYDVNDCSCNLLLGMGMASHFCWLSDNVLLAWCSGPNDEAAYYVYDFENEAWSLYDTSPDGHPTRLDRNYFLTETQKGVKSYQFIEYDLRVRNIMDPSWNKPVLKIGHPTILKGYQRCDLHVSVSDDNNWFQIDSLHKVNRRAVIVGSLQ